MLTAKFIQVGSDIFAQQYYNTQLLLRKAKQRIAVVE